jgi:hypothetical protein
MLSGKIKKLTHPLVLAIVALVVNLLLDDVLVGRVVRVEDLDGLPAALALVLVLGLECQTGDDNSQSQTLSVDTSLDELLLTTKVGVAADDTESSGDGGDPRAKDDTVAVPVSPVHCALRKRLLRLEFFLEGLLLVGVALLGMAGHLELARVTIGLDDCGESTSTGDQEGTEWQRQATESRVSSAGGQDTDGAGCCTKQTTNGTSIDGSA